MRLDLIDLGLFVQICESGTITGGARACHMTLASASERVRRMEDAVGVPLLLRGRRGVTLTPAGHSLLRHARLVLGQMACLQADMGDYGAGLRGHVGLLCNTSAASEHLPEVLSRYLGDHPGISLHLEERLSQEIVDALRAGDHELGVVSDAVDRTGLQSYAFRDDPLVLVAPLSHPLAQLRRIPLSDVAAHELVGLEEGRALQDLVAQYARRLGRRLHYRVRLRSLEQVCRMVGLGVGVGIVPRAVARRCGRQARIRQVALSDAWAQRRLYVCLRQREALSPHAAVLLQYLLGEETGAAASGAAASGAVASGAAASGSARL